MIVSFDPGRNVGVAFVSPTGKLERALVITLTELHNLAIPEHATVLVGDGTGSRDVQEVLNKRGQHYKLCPERDSSRLGRWLYLHDHPPRGLARLVPPGLRHPAEPVDAYAAYAIALRYLESLKQSGKEASDA